MTTKPTAAMEVPVIPRKSIYPEPLARRVEGRVKRRLGDYFGLSTFGINLTELAPGAQSSLAHYHTKQDEFIYVVSGNPTLILGDDEYPLKQGDCCGFKAGTQLGHYLINKSGSLAVYFEVGDRGPGDLAAYTKDDLKFTQVEGAWILTRLDGTLY